MQRLPLLVLLLTSLTACAGASSSSERQVLPSFDTRELANKRLLLAPYAAATLTADRPIPLAVADIRALAIEYPDESPDLTSLKAFYFAGKARAELSAKTGGKDATVVAVGASRWHEYFANPEQFLNVTVDGKAHYQVPQRELLERIGSDADIAIVVGSLAYSATVALTGNNLSVSSDRTASCDGSFLVWDYPGNRALAEGNVNSSVGFGNGVSRENFLALGGLMVAEIMAKKPFR